MAKIVKRAKKLNDSSRRVFTKMTGEPPLIKNANS